MAQQPNWRPVRGYAGLYEVSDWGYVRSVDRVEWVKSRWGTPMLRTRKGKMLAPYTDTDGYRSVVLSRDGKTSTRRIARLVLTAFESPCEGREAGHDDDDPQNDKLSNLFWQTRAENEAQKTTHGRRPKSTRGIFDAASVALVREMRTAGFALTDLGALFGVHYSTVGYICQNKTWSEHGCA